MKREDLQKLTHIRDLDVRILALREELEALPEEYALEELTARQAHEAVAAGEAGLQEARRAAQHAESDVKDHDEHIRKYSGQLATAKTNKEYEVILGQMNGAKLLLSKAEEAGLLALEKVEKSAGLIADLREAAKAKDAAAKAARGRVGGREESLRGEIAELEDRRAHLAKELEPAIVAVYDQIRERREGLGLVEVTDGTCQGCFVKITAQEQMLLGQRDELVRCRQCARILVLPM